MLCSSAWKNLHRFCQRKGKSLLLLLVMSLPAILWSNVACTSIRNGVCNEDKHEPEVAGNEEHRTVCFNPSIVTRIEGREVN